MASEISPRAEISPKAKIGDNCKIFPFVYIEDDVVIGDNCTIYPFVSILNGTRMGNNNKVHQGSVLGALPQDFHFKGEKSELVIGDNNVFRENVVINRATHTGGQTKIGNENFFMEGAHVSHDTVVGSYCVLGYGAKISGDCIIDDGVIISSVVIQHVNTHVGEGALVQAGNSFDKDVPPYVIAGGYPIGYSGVNSLVCKVHGIDEKTIKHIANAYRLVFHGQTSLYDAILQIKEQVPDGPEVQKIIKFLSETKLGVVGKKTF